MLRPGSHLGVWIIGGGVIGVRVQGCVEMSPTYAAEACGHRSLRALVTLNLKCLNSVGFGWGRSHFKYYIVSGQEEEGVLGGTWREVHVRPSQERSAGERFRAEMSDLWVAARAAVWE